MVANERLIVIDNHFPPDLLAEAAAAWPAPDWPRWYRYQREDEAGKLTCADRAEMPNACNQLLARLIVGRWPLVREFADAEPDRTLHGAGMHCMLPGAHLGVHLDASHHPVTGLQRVVNGLLYLGEWHPEWGGELELWNACPQEDAFVRDGLVADAVIEPRHGRLVLFRADDMSLHGVRKVTCPEGFVRKSLALYWYAPTVEPITRPRAHFQDRPGEVADRDREAERLARAGLAGVAA